MNTREVASKIDHTLLRPEVVETDIIKHCKEAEAYSFRSVCVFPSWVKICCDFLKNSEVRVCTVVGFPFGENTSYVKCLEAERAIIDGACDLDIVVNIGWVKMGDWKKVKAELRDILDISSGKITKVIIETCLLSKHEKLLLTAMLRDFGVDYVKTSTGFSNAGAQLEDVKMIFEKFKGLIGIKASGGIKTASQVLAFLKAGADIIGSSVGSKIVEEMSAKEG